MATPGASVRDSQRSDHRGSVTLPRTLTLSMFTWSGAIGDVTSSGSR